MNRKTFTLVEVLIVITVIGVVAALTIPTLINTISVKAKEAQTKTIEARLLDGINRYNAMEDGLSQPYSTTKEFLVGLSKYYKMSQICDSDEIIKCIPYSKIFYKENNIIKSVDVATLTTQESLLSDKVSDNYLLPASFITSQGTPVVIALKKGCIWDNGTAMKDIRDSGCISLMYDNNGVNLPNSVGDDIVSLGLSPVTQPLAVLGGIKIMTNAFGSSRGLTKAECEIEVGKREEYLQIPHGKAIRGCYHENDKWAYSMKYCKELGYRLPGENELIAIANALYKGMSANTSKNQWTCSETDEDGVNYKIGSNQPIPTALEGLGTSWQDLWSDYEYGNNETSYFRRFNSTCSYEGFNFGYSRAANFKGVCISD